jgi:hypothetical protein
MRSRPFPLVAAFLFVPVLVHASEAVGHVRLSAHVQSRTSLRVSSPVLSFVVGGDGETGSASIDYVAAARTPPDGEVVLSVEPLRRADGPGGAADAETDFSLNVPGHGRHRISTDPVAAARWVGSGSRAGRLTFTLRADAAGTYVLPVRLVLSAP